MNRKPLSPRRILTALAVTLLVAGLAPAVATSASASPAPVPAAAQGHKKHKMKVDAGVDKNRVKAGESTKVRGKLTDLTPNDGYGGFGGNAEPIVVQRLVGNAWVNVTTGTCRPNGNYVLNLSFNLHATLSLRVFHPETDLYISATSNIFALIVL